MTTRNSSATVLILRARAKALNSRANRSVSGGRSFMSSANMVSGSRDGFCTNFFSFGEVVITMCRMPSFVISFQRAYGYPGAHGSRYRTAVCPNVVLSDLDSGQFPMAVATNFRISFDLFRAVRTSLSVDERQALRKRVKGCEDHSNCASHHKQNYCCLAHSKPHCLTSV